LLNIQQGVKITDILKYSDNDWCTAIKQSYESKIAKVDFKCDINTPEGVMVADVGDYIVVDVEGNQYIIKSDLMEYNYSDLTLDVDSFVIDFNTKPVDTSSIVFYTGVRVPSIVRYAVINDDFNIIQQNDCMYGEKNDILIETDKNGKPFYYRIYPKIFNMTYNIIKYAVYLGRFSPIHKGHQKVISKMVSKFGYKSSLLLIGSSVSKLGNRLFYTYLQRKNMIKKLYPKITVVGLPDYKDVYPGDLDFTQWHSNLWDIINLRFPTANIQNTVFIGGALNDVYFFKDSGYNVVIMDRYDVDKMSATEVRQRLVLDEYGLNADLNIRSLIELCDEDIIKDIKKYYNDNLNLIYSDEL